MTTQTHENYIRAVADLAIAMADLNDSERDHLKAIKLVYGSGPEGTRGVTFYNRFKPNGREAVPFVELSAFGQESVVQLTGTCIHELGHVLAGWNAGHGKDWKSACHRLGIRCIKAAGTNYTWAMFEPRLREAIKALRAPDEGQPIASLFTHPGLPLGTKTALKPCGAGLGTRGGKSRGKGSGSRLRLYQCQCGQKIRASTDALNATHNPCGTQFVAK